MMTYALAALLVYSASAAAAAAGARRSNIVFLMSDSMDGRLLDPTSAESAVVDLPFLRGFFARNGVSFTRSYSNAPMCVPSRTSMVTGRSTDKIEVWGNSKGLAAAPNGVLDAKCVKQYGKEMCKGWAKDQGYPETIFSAMKQLGYRVRVEGRLHVGGALMNSEAHNETVDGTPKFEPWDWIRPGEMTRAADLRLPAEKVGHILEQTVDDATDDSFFAFGDRMTVNRCKNWIQTLPSPAEESPPFFLYCSLNLPHYQFMSNQTWLAKVHENKINMPPLLANFPDAWHPYDSYMSIAQGFGGNFSDEEVLKLRRVYYGMCAETDEILSGVWDALQQKGYSMNDTYMMYISDHGEMKGEHRQYGKASMYEGSVRVPLMLAGPGVTRGKIINSHLTTLLDVFPTLLDMAGESEWDRHAQLQGLSLLPAAGLSDSTSAPEHFRLAATEDSRDLAISQYHWTQGNTGAFMVRSGPWKLITYGHNFDAYRAYRPQLFNLNNDPDELHDVAADYPRVAERLDARLREVLDPEEVDLRAKQSDFTFLRWMQTQRKDDKFGSLIRMGYQGYDELHEKQLSAWIEEASNLFEGASTKSASLRASPTTQQASAAGSGGVASSLRGRL